MIHQLSQLPSDHGPIDTRRRKITSLGKGTDPTDWYSAPWSAENVRPRHVQLRIAQRAASFGEVEKPFEGVIKSGLAPTVRVAASAIDAQGAYSDGHKSEDKGGCTETASWHGWS